MSLQKKLNGELRKEVDDFKKDMMILKKQQPTDGGKFVDLLGLDNDGNVVVIEIKKESNDLAGALTNILLAGNNLYRLPTSKTLVWQKQDNDDDCCASPPPGSIMPAQNYYGFHRLWCSVFYQLDAPWNLLTALHVTILPSK